MNGAGTAAGALAASVVVAALTVVPGSAAAQGGTARAGTAESALDRGGDLELEAQGVRKFRKRRRPAQFGTSMGNVEDFDGFACSSGTGGALLVMNGAGTAGAAEAARYFILSNNHVFAILNGRGTVGDPISQPGNIDTRPACLPEDEDIVGTLSGWRKIRFGGNRKNRVDMALAEADPGAVRTDGRQVKIGVPGNDWVAPFLFQAVQKDGRTTGHTVGEVIDVSATVRVDYPTGPGPFAEVERALFTRQIVIASTGNKSFAQSGDSGAVIYEKVRTCPRAVGLLFGANDELAVANPMKFVLAQARKIKPKGLKELAGCDPVPGLQAVAAPLIEERLVRRAVRIKERWTGALMDLPGVVGVGVGAVSRQEPHEVVIRVYFEGPAEEVQNRVPAEIQGVRTVLVPGGSFVAF